MGNWLCRNYPKDTQEDGLTMDVVRPRTDHKSTLIFLHGLGDTGRNWSQHLKKIVPSHCKIICPDAPSIEVFINQNATMPAWFDIYGLTIDAPQDEPGIKNSAEQISQLIKKEVETSGVPLNRIVLGGFSQGGSVALYTALTSADLQGLGGVVILSSWLPLAQQLANDTSQIHADRGLPILHCHGAADPLVSYPVATLTNNFLQNFNFKSAELQKLPDLGHECSEEEFKIAKKFFQRVLKV